MPGGYLGQTVAAKDNVDLSQMLLFSTLRGLDKLSGKATGLKLSLPPFWKGVYFKKESICPPLKKNLSFQKGLDVQGGKQEDIPYQI